MNDTARQGDLAEFSAALSARYGVGTQSAAGPWNATIAALLDHRSVRGYRSTPVPAGTLDTLVAAAQSAPTSSNLQTWSVVEVADPAHRRELAAIAGNQKHVETCPLFLVWLADLSRLERLGNENGVTLAGLDYLEVFTVAVVDAAMAAQNAVVAAESLGLSTVYIGALRNDVERVARLLHLPPRAFAVFGLCVGYAEPAAAGEVKPRLPQSMVLHRGRYGTEGEAPARAAYDRTLSAFSAGQEMSDDDWTGRVIARIGTVPALRGRDRLKAALAALGFQLK